MTVILAKQSAIGAAISLGNRRTSAGIAGADAGTQRASRMPSSANWQQPD
jgi:hypothetical protein